MSAHTRAELLARYQQLGGAPGAELAASAPASGVASSGPGQPTAVHRAAVELLDELLNLVPHDAQPFGSIIKNLRRLEPMLLRDFAKVPEENVALFLHELGQRMLNAAAASHTDFPKAGTCENTEEAESADRAGSDIATG